MAYRIKEGDLVQQIGSKEPYALLVVKGPYMATFINEENKYSEECLAVDVIYEGKIITKVKCNLLQQVAK